MTRSVLPTAASSAPQGSPIHGEKVTYQNDGLTLVGYLFKPAGSGPFPAVIWNHGSEQNPSPERQFGGIAAQLVPAGYVVMCPVRRGHGESQGPYIVDQTKKEMEKNGREAAAKLMVQLMEGPQLRDQRAGLAYLKKLPYVDTNRIAVTGCSYGGIETLLGAESEAGYKAAIALSPGAESWAGNEPLRNRLLRAVRHVRIPVFLIHPEKDANVSPGYTLGQELQKLNKPYSLRIYAPFGSSAEQGHCFGGAVGMHIWAPDAVEFLKQTLH